MRFTLPIENAGDLHRILQAATTVRSVTRNYMDATAVRKIGELAPREARRFARAVRILMTFAESLRDAPVEMGIDVTPADTPPVFEHTEAGRAAAARAARPGSAG